MPSEDKFYDIIKTNFDYEIAEQLKKDIARIAKAGSTVNKSLDCARKLINDIRAIELRKRQAEMITQSYSHTNSLLMPIAFNLLDNKAITNDQLLKLMHFYVEKS